jgi:hypothetical protein
MLSIEYRTCSNVRIASLVVSDQKSTVIWRRVMVITLGVRVDEFTGHTFYIVTCPVCGASYEQVTKKARRDPSFVLEYEYEIRMVVFDLLLYHLQGEHQLGE